MNLLDETLEIMRENGEREDDVLWVGSREVEITWEAFKRLADTEYGNGFGWQCVAKDLMVVFRDGCWLERHEYDGSEWWEFKATPLRPDYLEAKPDRVISDIGWSSLAEMNGPLGILEEAE